MNIRKTETALAYFTLAVLVIYIPVETWASLPYGLPNPFYLVDLIAMVLLLSGSIRSLRARPAASPGVLCAAYAWTAANGWRASFGRLDQLSKGGSLDHGTSELWAVGIASALGLIGFALSLYLVIRTTPTKS